MADDAARRRARGLLLSTLDDEQRRDLARYGGFRIRTIGRMYWIRPGSLPVCADLTYARLIHYCVAPDRRAGMPADDVALTYLLWITGDEGEFARRANVLATNPLPSFSNDDELVAALARIAGRGPRLPAPRAARTSPRPQRMQPSPPPTEEERARTRLMARRIAVDLRVRRMKEHLAGCVRIDEVALRRALEERLEPGASRTGAPNGSGPASR